MLIETEITGNTYINLINYIFKKCDVVSLTKYHDQHEDRNNKVINIILSTANYSQDDILNKCSDKFLNKIYNEFKDNINIFDEEYKNKYERNIYGFDKERLERHKKFNRKTIIESSIKRFVYNSSVNLWINKYKENIILKKERIIEQTIHHSTIYYIKMNDELKKEILNKVSLYDWHFPISIEDISFFKDEYCWLYSVAHENICEIYCESEEEYEYLKSIGIEFVDNEFKPISKDKLHFENY